MRFIWGMTLQELKFLYEEVVDSHPASTDLIIAMVEDNPATATFFVFQNKITGS